MWYTRAHGDLEKFSPKQLTSFFETDGHRFAAVRPKTAKLIMVCAEGGYSREEWRQVAAECDRLLSDDGHLIAGVRNEELFNFAHEFGRKLYLQKEVFISSDRGKEYSLRLFICSRSKSFLQRACCFDSYDLYISGTFERFLRENTPLYKWPVRSKHIVIDYEGTCAGIMEIARARGCDVKSPMHTRSDLFKSVSLFDGMDE